MEILEKHHDDVVLGAEVWLVRPDHIDDVLRVCTFANTEPPEGSRSSVIVATDAELSAGSLISTLRSCAVGLDLPPVRAVSVGYPLDAHPPFAVRRDRDLTPSAWPDFDPVHPAMIGWPGTMPSGGGPRFLDFLADELLPAVADAFPVDPADATLTGQSFGGLFVLHALLTRPDAFRRYLAVSPSVWWHDREMVHAAQKIVQESAAPSADLYMCVGELENKARFGRQFGPSLPDEIRSLLPAAMLGGDMQGDVFVMEQILRGWAGDSFSVEAHIYPEESHESIMGSAYSRGLRRLYRTV